MFEHLTQYNKIIVSGPQRSGTTITARIIARDTGYQYIDETDIAIRELTQFEAYLNNDDNLVIHCPAIAHKLHEYGNQAILIVWCKRPLEAILASQQRIAWGEQKERDSYRYKGKEPIAKVKQEYWQQYQRQLIKHWLEVDYSSLKDHPLWIEPEYRKEFEARQWKTKPI